MKNNQEVINYINNLKNYCGYVQFSDEKIRECDIFKEYQDIQLIPTQGFIYEAHFCNGTESIAIKQINDGWLVSKTSLSEVQNKEKDMQVYHAINGLQVKMAQIWEAENDPLCENMPVLKLKKVVFAGFEGENNE